MREYIKPNGQIELITKDKSPKRTGCTVAGCQRIPRKKHGRLSRWCNYHQEKEMVKKNGKIFQFIEQTKKRTY